MINNGLVPPVAMTIRPQERRAGQAYSIIEGAGGRSWMVVADGDGYRIRPNPDHRGYQPDATNPEQRS